MSVLLEASLTPLDKGESVSQYVSRSLEIIDKSGIDYRVGPMGTCLEGEWDDVMNIVKKCFEAIKRDCRRISISIKADYREGKTNCLQTKIESLKKRLGRGLKK